VRKVITGIQKEIKAEENRVSMVSAKVGDERGTFVQSVFDIDF